MAGWKMVIDIKPILGSTLSLTDMAEAISELFHSKIENIESGDEELKTLLQDLLDAETEHEFNAVLDDLYDWADASRVWLGVMGT